MRILAVPYFLHTLPVSLLKFGDIFYTVIKHSYTVLQLITSINYFEAFFVHR